jgi:hypothetical protein
MSLHERKEIAFILNKTKKQATALAPITAQLVGKRKNTRTQTIIQPLIVFNANNDEYLRTFFYLCKQKSQHKR